SPSGAGKTSLIQAKLIPKLQEEDFQVLPVIRVGLEPRSIVGQAGNPSSANRYVLSALHSLDTELPEEQQTPPAELAGLELAAYLQRWPATEDGSKPQVLIFDQFEE